jgi:hypothetical protein
VGAPASPAGKRWIADVTTTGLQRTSYALYIALILYVWMVGG